MGLDIRSPPHPEMRSCQGRFESLRGEGPSKYVYVCQFQSVFDLDRQRHLTVRRPAGKNMSGRKLDVVAVESLGSPMPYIFGAQVQS